MPDEESDSDGLDVHPAMDELLEEMAGQTGHPKSVVARTLAQYDLDVEAVGEENAEKLQEAFEEGDTELVEEVLVDEGVPEENIELFRAQVADLLDAREGGGEGVSEGNGQPPSTETSPAPGGGEGALTDTQRQEVSQIVAQTVEHSVPSADEIVSRLEERAGGGGGGGGGGTQSEQNQLASLISLAELFSGGGGGGMSQLGEKFHRAALNGYIQKLNRPSLGEIIEMRMYDKLADDVSDEYMEELFEDPLEDLEMFDEDEED